MAGKYDFINRFRNYADSNHWKDTANNYWRKVTKISKIKTPRGTQDTGFVVQDQSALSDSRRPYAISGDYGDMMDQVTRTGIQALYGKEAYSERDKPYATDDDYQELEYKQPELWGITPWIPTIKRPGLASQETPSTGMLGKCGIVLYSPMTCDGDVVGLPTTIYYIPGNIKPIDQCRIKVWVNGHRYYNFDSKGVVYPIQIHPPSGGWSPVYSVIYGCKQDLDKDIVEIELTDGIGNKCYAKEEVFCRGTCDNCCVAEDYVAMTFDDASTPDTIVKDSSISIYVLNGCPPFTFETSSTGYTFNGGVQSYETDNRVATLSCVDGTCEVDFDVVANISVTDACEDTVNVEIRNTSGQWVTVTAACPVAFVATETWYNAPNRYCRGTNGKWRLTQWGSSSGGSSTSNCINPLNIPYCNDPTFRYCMDCSGFPDLYAYPASEAPWYKAVHWEGYCICHSQSDPDHYRMWRISGNNLEEWQC